MRRGASIGLSIALTIIVGGALVWDRIYRIPARCPASPLSPGALLVIEHGGVLPRGVGVARQEALRPPPERRQGVLPPQRRRTPITVRAPVEVRTYRVREGESLSTIAKKFYLRSSRWPEIAQANNLTEPFLIRTGQTLKIP